MKRLSVSRISEWGVLVLLTFSILWKGGKGLESTWLLAIVAGTIALFYALKRLLRIPSQDTAAPARKAEVPFMLWGMVLALIFLTIASYLHSSTRNYGLDVVIRNTSFSLLFFWTVRTGMDGVQNRFLRRVISTLTIAITLAALIGIAVYVLQPVNRFVGTFFDYRFDTDYWPNAWAECVLLAWPLIAIQMIQLQNARLRSLVLVCIGLVLGTLLLSYSRGALLALFVQIAIMCILFAALGFRDIRYKRILKSVRRTIAINSIIIAVVAVALFVGVNAIRSQFNSVQSVAEKVTFTASEGTSSIDERNAFWHQAFQLSKDHPLLGYGPYSFRFVQPQLMTSVLATADHAHNVILNTALDRGWIAAVLGILIVFYAVGSSTKMLFTVRREWSQEKDIIAIMLIIAVLGVYAHNMIDYNLQFVGIALPFWLCLGFLVIPATSKNDGLATSFMRWKFSQHLFRLKIMLAISLLAVTAYEGAGLVLSSLGRHAEAEGHMDEALMWYRRASFEWFSRDMHLSEAQIYLQKNDPASALHTIDVYMKENAWDARAWTLQGTALLRENRVQEAEQSLNRAYALGKYTDLQILDLLLQTARDPVSAKNLASRKLEFDALFSEYANAIEKDTHFIALSLNVEELLSVSRELSQMFPTDEKRYKQIARSAADHAHTERERLSAHAQGMLW